MGGLWCGGGIKARAAPVAVKAVGQGVEILAGIDTLLLQPFPYLIPGITEVFKQYGEIGIVGRYIRLFRV